ncbi:hypothetical protein PR003_g27837 [Phytophthora rubi]|uniref:Uncharacterized protein n=1 Tax=Phytophthora rubi TaxID=129364 RepID=A0A6A4BYK5_9STRA|nr:hypothetical protein PR003_g27837 [Phytophthora rubi]
MNYSLSSEVVRAMVSSLSSKCLGQAWLSSDNLSSESPNSGDMALWMVNLSGEVSDGVQLLQKCAHELNRSSSVAADSLRSQWKWTPVDIDSGGVGVDLI